VLTAVAAQPDVLWLGMDGEEEAQACLAAICAQLAPLWEHVYGGVFAPCTRATAAEKADLQASLGGLRAAVHALPASLRPLLPEAGHSAAAAAAGAREGQPEAHPRPAAAAFVPAAGPGPISELTSGSASAGKDAKNSGSDERGQPDAEKAALVAFAAECQSQAQQAIARADMVHGMFMNAAARIESLVHENLALRRRVEELLGHSSAAAERPRASSSAATSAWAEVEEESALKIPSTRGASHADTSTDEDAGCFTPDKAKRLDTKQAAMVLAGLQEAVAALHATLKTAARAPQPVVLTAEAVQPYVDTFRAAMAYAKAHIPATTERLKPASLAMSSVRRFVKLVGLLSADFSAKDLDIVLSRVGVHHVSLFGFTYVLVMCAGKRFVGRATGAVLAQLRLQVTAFLASAAAGPYTGSVTSPFPRIPLPAEEQGHVSKLLEAEKLTLHTIFQCYVGVPTLLGKPGARHWSLESAAAFALDFDIIPQVATVDQVHALFHQHCQTDNELEYPAFCDMLVSLARAVGEQPPHGMPGAEGALGRGQPPKVITLLCDLLMLLNSRIVAWHDRVSRRLFHRHRGTPVASFNLQSIRAAQLSATPATLPPLLSLARRSEV